MANRDFVKYHLREALRGTTAEMDGDERERVFQQYAAFRRLPEKRQEFCRSRARELKAFINTLSLQDRAVLTGMSDQQRARRLLQLWQARYGTW